jgi:hypothetical protein
MARTAQHRQATSSDPVSTLPAVEGETRNRPVWPADRVERRPLAGLIANARNSRLHSDAQIEQIVASIRQFGWTIPVLVDEAGEIIAGHGRLRAAELLKLDDVPVMVATGWSDGQKRAYLIADNKLTLNATWDEALLSLELAELREMGVDLALTGFSGDELQELLSNDVGHPVSFNAYGSDIATDHKCPKCGYVWSGKSS